MSERERTREIEIADSAKVAELYALIHLGLEGATVHNDDGHSRASSWTVVVRNKYAGYIHVEAVDPFSVFNNTGLCAMVSTGELDEGKEVDFGNSGYLDDVKELEHLTKTYFIYHDGSRLSLGVNTTVQKPADSDNRSKSEELLHGDADLGRNLSTVYTNEAEELIARLRGVLAQKQ